VVRFLAHTDTTVSIPLFTFGPGHMHVSPIKVNGHASSEQRAVQFSQSQHTGPN